MTYYYVDNYVTCSVVIFGVYTLAHWTDIKVSAPAKNDTVYRVVQKMGH